MLWCQTPADFSCSLLFFFVSAEYPAFLQPALASGKLFPSNSRQREVKAANLSGPEITRGLRNFISRYKPQEGFVINLSYKGESAIDKTKVRFILPYEIERLF